MPNVWDILCNIKAIGGWLMKGYLKCTMLQINGDSNRWQSEIGGKCAHFVTERAGWSFVDGANGWKSVKAKQCPCTQTISQLFNWKKKS